MITFVGAARRWLEKEPPRFITTWDDLVSKFINEFFPPSRTTNLRNEILNFQQKFNESFHEAWERYKDLLRACPPHGYTELHQLDTFYNTLNPADQDSLNAAAGGNLLEKVRKIPQVKAVEEICVTCEGAHPYYQCLAAGGNTFLEFRDNIQEKIKRMNDVSLKAMQNQINMVKNELRNEMKTSIQTSLSNQTNEIKNMIASLLQINVASTSRSGSLPGNTVANPKGELKAITIRSGLVTDGPIVLTHPKSVTPEEDECVEETYMDQNLVEYTIKVPPPSVQKPKPPIQRYFVLHTRDSSFPNISNPSRMLKQKQQEKDDIQIQKFWQMFKQLHLNITLVEALVLMPKYQKMLKALLSNKEKLQELANTPLNENCLASSLILGRPFLRSARALMDVYGKEMILRDGDERLTLNMKHDTASYSNHPHRESVNLVNIFNISSEDCLEVSVSNQQSGNPTFLLQKEITSPKVTHEIHDSEGCNFLSEELPDIDSFNDIHPHFDDNPLSGSTTYLSNSLLEEFTDELALITYPLDYDDNLKCDIESDLREIEFLLYQGKDYALNDSIDQTDLANRDDLFVDPMPEIFNDVHAPDYSFLSRFDVYDDDFLEIEFDADNFYDDHFDSKGEKIKESELLIDELDLPCDILPYSEYDSFNS
nr:reverse transcriptase domain-containing protein [Tanacetum cinerariifolium]